MSINNIILNKFGMSFEAIESCVLSPNDKDKSFLKRLPLDLIKYIFSLVETPDAKNVALTCKYFCNIVIKYPLFNPEDPCQNKTSTFFKAAIAKSRISGLERFLEYYYKGEERETKMIAALMHASEIGNTAIVEMLLKKGVDPSHADHKAFRNAMKNHHLPVLKLFLAHPKVDPTTGDNIFIKWASEDGYVELIQLLLEDGRSNPADEKNRAIQLAAKKGHLKAIKVLLKDKRVDPTDDDNAAIKWACSNNKTEIVKTLLEYGCDASASGGYPFQWACGFGDVDIVKLMLLNPKVDPTQSDHFAFFTACTNGRAEVVKVLLDIPSLNPAFRDNYALRIACIKGNVKVARALLNDSRVDPNAKGCEALRAAGLHNHMEIVNILLDSGKLDLEKALHCAISHKLKSLIELINEKSKSSRSPKQSSHR